MSLFVLDTDMLTLYREGHPAVSQHVQAHQSDDLAITVITVEEQISGWYVLLRRAKTTEQLAHVYQRLTETVQFLSHLQILSFTESAVRYTALRSMKLNVGKMDLRIAAITLENQGILVTRNSRDFQRIPNLVLEDWSR